MFKSSIATAVRFIRGAGFRGTKPIALLDDFYGELPGKVVIRCKYGRAWITQRSDPKDYILGHGESLTLSLDRQPLLSLSERSLVEISAGRLSFPQNASDETRPKSTD
jgi:hypothetical protein